MKKIVGTLCVAALAATIVVAQDAAKKPAEKKAAANSSMSHGDMGAAKSPYVGTWKLNVEKSQYDNAAMKPKSATLHITKWDANTIAWTFRATDAKGKPMGMSYAAPNDGKTHKVSGDPQMAAGAEFKSSGNDVDITWKDAKGNTIGTEHSTLAADGKSFTTKQTFKDPGGKDVNSTEVYDKSAGGTMKAAQKSGEKK